ncbi:SCP2 sterol-binding domain-containing protein [Chloroflexota bacterium]
MELLSYLAGLASQVNSSAKLQNAVPSWSAIIQFEFPNEESFHLTIDQGKWRVDSGPHIKPTLVLQSQEVDLEPIFSGDIDISHFFAEGKMRVTKGQYLEAVNLSRVALAAKRQRR